MRSLLGVKRGLTVAMRPRRQLLRRAFNGWQPVRAVRVVRFSAHCPPGIAGAVYVAGPM